MPTGTLIGVWSLKHFRSSLFFLFASLFSRNFPVFCPQGLCHLRKGISFWRRAPFSPLVFIIFFFFISPGVLVWGQSGRLSLLSWSSLRAPSCFLVLLRFIFLRKCFHSRPKVPPNATAFPPSCTLGVLTSLGFFFQFSPNHSPNAWIFRFCT